MGKKNKAKAKNVFKVAGARCQKAKKVKTTLKKLDLGQGGKLNKEKTNLINKQLAEISKEVHQSAGKKNKPKTAKPSGGPAVKLATSVSKASKQQTANLIQELKL